MPSIRDFSDRATECVRSAERAKSEHDRELFLALARAWCGIKQDEDEDARTREQTQRPH
jgi:hypothetical protein